jgi:5-formyltetrahydrofolate cyclo-ligase
MDEKAALRAHFRAFRAAIPPVEAQAAALRIAERARDLIEVLRRKGGLSPAQAPVALYFALPGELDCAPLLKQLAALDYPTLLPTAGAKATALTFRLWRPGDTLVAGRYGVSEPAPAAIEATPKILLAPLLAFDERGGRLGFGGGYYDATIAAMRAQDTLLAAGGLAFAKQKAPALPMEKHDAPLDFVVTEEEILTFME